MYLILVSAITIIYIGVVVRIYRSWRRTTRRIWTNRVQIEKANRKRNHSTRFTPLQSDIASVNPQFNNVDLLSLSVQTVCRRQQAIQRTYHSSEITTIQLDTFPVNTQVSTSGQSSPMPKSISNTGSCRIFKTVITLGILISILLMSMMPKIILGFAVIRNPSNEKFIRALAISDLILFLNPLLDPVVYVLRIRSFRQRIKCSSH
ncbi:unnamed protein product [Mytilus edulis]|uniref:G-protein coupled receptors family 1 profile domain-containing protein n=1 Tax=Mytilus edulis TaxID=6550 RepID=A0A8S3RNP8_MYTED|nr:unnamed protein product [Mytilus edulis]